LKAKLDFAFKYSHSSEICLTAHFIHSSVSHLFLMEMSQAVMLLLKLCRCKYIIFAACMYL